MTLDPGTIFVDHFGGLSQAQAGLKCLSRKDVTKNPMTRWSEPQPSTSLGQQVQTEASPSDPEDLESPLFPNGDTKDQNTLSSSRVSSVGRIQVLL